MQILFRTLCSLSWDFTWGEIDCHNPVACMGLHLGVRLTFVIGMMYGGECVVATHDVATHGCTLAMAV